MSFVVIFSILSFPILSNKIVLFGECDVNDAVDATQSMCYEQTEVLEQSVSGVEDGSVLAPTRRDDSHRALL